MLLSPSPNAARVRAICFVDARWVVITRKLRVSAAQSRQTNACAPSGGVDVDAVGSFVVGSCAAAVVAVVVVSTSLCGGEARFACFV